MHGDVCAHAGKLWHVHEAVFKHGFRHHARALGNCQHGHHLRLQVGGEAGVGFRHDIDAAQNLARAFNVNVIALGSDIDACLVQGVDQIIDMLDFAAFQRQVATRHRGGNGEGAGLDPVGCRPRSGRQ